MPAILILAIFSFIFAIMSGYILDIAQSRQEMSKIFAEQTKAYFAEIYKFVLLDVMPNSYEITPHRSAAWSPAVAGQKFLSQEAVRRLGPPYMNQDPMLDAWGRPITVLRVDETMALDARTVAPSTGIFLHSAGADGISQTSLVGVPMTSVGLGSVDPAGDDIVKFFNNKEALEKVYKQIQADLESMRNIVERDFNTRFSAYREAKDEAYRVAVASNPGLAPPDYNALATTDVNFPKFADVGDSATRLRLGITEACGRIERTVPQGGRMLVRSITHAEGPLTLIYGVINDPVNPSPWSALGPRVTIRVKL